MPFPINKPPKPSTSSKSVTFSTNTNNYPVGLIHLTYSSSNPLPSASSNLFTITQINTFALDILHLKQNPTFSLFKQSTQSFILTKLHDSNNNNNNDKDNNDKTLYDIIISNHNAYCSNFINEINQVIHVKIKKNLPDVYIVIDDYEDNRASIQEKMMASIPRQHLITISHELKNYFCGVLTSLEDSKTNLEETQLLYLSSCIDLIKKFIKLFILYVQVCMDKSLYTKNQTYSSLDFFTVFNNAFDKVRVIYKYKHISVDLNKNTSSFKIKTEFQYFKNFIKIIFIYVYYISPNDAQIVLTISKHSKNSVLFQCAFAHNDNSQGLYIKRGSYTMLDSSDKMNDPGVKQSVLTIPLIEYVLEKIAEFLKIEIQFKKKNSENTSYHNNEMFLNIIFTQVVFDELTINNNILTVFTNQTRTSTLHLNNFGVNDPTASGNNDLENKGSVIMFSYERKNTMERARYSTDNIRNGLHANSKFTMSIDPMSSAKINSLTQSGGKYANGVHKSSFCEWDKEGKDNQTNVNNITTTNNITTNANPQQKSLFRQNKIKSTNHFRKFNFSIDTEPQIEHRRSVKNKNISQRNKQQFQFTLSEEKNQDKSFSNANDLIHSHQHLAMLSKTPKIEINNPSELSSQGNTLILGTLYQGLPGSNGTVNPLYGTSVRKRIHLIEEYSNINLNNILRPPPCECKDIALVDDENFIINSISSMIRSQKLKCDCFSDGKYCYDKILEKTKCYCKRRYYKLILMDIYMHDWSGIKTCEKIGELIAKDIIPKTVNVVLISAHKEKDLNIPNYDFIKGFYQKPVCKKTIVSILNEFYF